MIQKLLIVPVSCSSSYTQAWLVACDLLVHRISFRFHFTFVADGFASLIVILQNKKTVM